MCPSVISVHNTCVCDITSLTAYLINQLLSLSGCLSYMHVISPTPHSTSPFFFFSSSSLFPVVPLYSHLPLLSLSPLQVTDLPLSPCVLSTVNTCSLVEAKTGQSRYGPSIIREMVLLPSPPVSPIVVIRNRLTKCTLLTPCKMLYRAMDQFT